MSNPQFYFSREQEINNILKEMEEIGSNITLYWLKFIRLVIELIQIFDINAKFNNNFPFPYQVIDDANDCAEIIYDLLKNIKSIICQLFNSKQINDFYKLESLLYKLQYQTLSYYNYTFKTKNSSLLSLVNALSSVPLVRSVVKRVLPEEHPIVVSSQHTEELNITYSNVIEELNLINESNGLRFVNKAIIRVIDLYNVIADFNGTHRIYVGVVTSPQDKNIMSVNNMVECMTNDKKILLNFIEQPTKEHFTKLSLRLWNSLANIMVYNTIYYNLTRIDQSRLINGDPRTEII